MRLTVSGGGVRLRASMEVCRNQAVVLIWGRGDWGANYERAKCVVVRYVRGNPSLNTHIYIYIYIYMNLYLNTPGCWGTFCLKNMRIIEV